MKKRIHSCVLAKSLVLGLVLVAIPRLGFTVGDVMNIDDRQILAQERLCRAIINSYDIEGIKNDIMDVQKVLLRSFYPKGSLELAEAFLANDLDKQKAVEFISNSIHEKMKKEISTGVDFDMICAVLESTIESEVEAEGGVDFAQFFKDFSMSAVGASRIVIAYHVATQESRGELEGLETVLASAISLLEAEGPCDLSSKSSIRKKAFLATGVIAALVYGGYAFGLKPEVGAGHWNWVKGL